MLIFQHLTMKHTIGCELSCHEPHPSQSWTWWERSRFRGCASCKGTGTAGAGTIAGSGDHFAWQPELRNGRTGNGSQGVPKQVDSAIGGDKEIQRKSRNLVEQLWHKVVWQKSRAQWQGSQKKPTLLNGKRRAFSDPGFSPLFFLFFLFFCFLWGFCTF